MLFFFFFLRLRRPPRSTQSRSSAASDVYKRQVVYYILVLFFVPLCLRGNFKTKLLGFCFCILLTVPFLGDTMRLMLFARVPLLYLGVCAADYGSRYPTLTKRTVLALLGAMAAGITILLVCYSVSYTHLRAHETRHELVCRLLLEKKKGG